MKKGFFGIFESIFKDSCIRNLFFVSLLLHVICAFFSYGFDHPDEHFQILELINLKLGGISRDKLFWDFHLAMRSWTQPFFYFVLVKIMSFIGIINPFTWAFFLRLLSSLAGFASLISLYAVYAGTIRTIIWNRLLFILISTLWFIPYIHARTSSENLSSSFFILGMAILLHYSKAKEKIPPVWAILSGLLAGFSFSFRFQMGFPVMLVFFWVLLYGNISYKGLFLYAASIIFTLIFMFLVDCWGYGEFVFTPWNYLRENIINNRVSDFGVMPWWGYFKLIAIKGIPPISVPLMLLVGFYWIKHWKEAITWASLGFFIVHILIGHKELRFLNFIYLLSPYLACFAYRDLAEKYQWLRGKWAVRVAVFSCVINVILLVVMVFKPAYTPLGAYRFIYDNVPSNTTILGFDSQGKSPKLQLAFFRKSGVKILPWNPVEDIPPEGWVISTRYMEYQKMKKMSGCRNRYSTYPEWIFRFDFGRWTERSSIWTIWKCKSQ